MEESEERPGTIDILLVEDNQGDVRLLEEALAEIGPPHELHVVTSGTLAVDFLLQRNDYEDAPRPHVILLDLVLPEKSGWDVLEAIEATGREELQSVPVIVLTHSQDVDNVFESLDQEVHVYFTKPFHPNGYTDLVRDIVSFIPRTRCSGDPQ